MLNIQNQYDVVILGAGPAGMSAALRLQGCGLSIAVFDEQSHAGGQIYRNVKNFGSNAPGSKKSTHRGLDLINRFSQAEVDYFPETFVWYLDGISLIAVKHQGQVYRTACQYLLIATGAQERPLAFEGWELPGVMGVGAAQILLKDAAAVPTEPPVLFGSGPLLYLYIAQLLSLGVKPNAILDTTVGPLRSLKKLPSALSAPGYLIDGLSMLHRIHKARIPVYKHVEKLKALGNGRVDCVEFHAAGRVHRIDTGLLLSHHGVIPETRLLQTLGVRFDWDDSGQCWRPMISGWGQCSEDCVYVAGDGAGIGGSISAGYTGDIAALDILYKLNAISESQRDAQSLSLLKSLKRDMRIRSFLEARYRVADSLLVPPEKTMVCRCESVYAAEITEAIQHGCTGPNQLKAFTRCGMGACQGRQCGPIAEAMIAAATSLSRVEVGRFRARAPVQPISLDAIASLSE